MTKKEKALTLCANISLLAKKNGSPELDKELIKSIAKYMVDEIIKSKPIEPKGYTNTIGYWDEVKQEIEKL